MGRGKGKSGGYRTITFYSGDDAGVPDHRVFKGSHVAGCLRRRSRRMPRCAGLVLWLAWPGPAEALCLLREWSVIPA
jgi:hypothetical protein